MTALLFRTTEVGLSDTTRYTRGATESRGADLSLSSESSAFELRARALASRQWRVAARGLSRESRVAVCRTWLARHRSPGCRAARCVRGSLRAPRSSDRAWPETSSGGI